MRLLTRVESPNLVRLLGIAIGKGTVRGGLSFVTNHTWTRLEFSSSLTTSISISLCQFFNLKQSDFVFMCDLSQRVARVYQ